MRFLKYFLIFLFFNFTALGFGVLLMGDGATSLWYKSLNQAPWTPPNWMFGAVWFVVMLCFSVYMAFLYLKRQGPKVISLFISQFILNILWNYVFFNQQLITIGALVILLLTLTILSFLIIYRKVMSYKNLLVIPYAAWICIATSLNLYIMFNN